MIQSLNSIWTRFCENTNAPFMSGPGGDLNRGDLLALVERFATTFDSYQLNANDRVLIVCNEEHAATSAFIGCILHEIVPVMLAPDTPLERCREVAKTVTAKLAIIDSSLVNLENTVRCLVYSQQTDKTHSALSWMTKRKRRCDEIATRLSLNTQRSKPRLPQNPDGLLYILFTSGTTQNPTGVMILRRNYIANIETISQVLEVDQNSVVYNDMLLSHGDGLVQGPLLALYTGCSIFRAGGFKLTNIEDWLNGVRQARATHCIAVATVWSMIDRYAAHDDYFDAPEFKHLSSVAALLPPDLWERIERRFNHRLTNQYGLTETVASAIYAGPITESNSYNSIGVPVDCEARLQPIEQTANEREGELQLRGENIFPGYWKNQVRTDTTFTEDGWMRTGDLARQDANGGYQILGRLKTVILSGGLLIRPEEIDEVMRAHPGISEVATISIDHEEFGEIAVCAVVENSQSKLDEMALADYARKNLEPLKIPKRFVILENIPRGPAGKPQINALRVAIEDAAADGNNDSTHYGDANGDKIEQHVFEIAASVFRTPVGELSSKSQMNTIEGWDSFAHTALVLELEEKFNCRIPPSKVASIRKLGDATEIVEELME